VASRGRALLADLLAEWPDGRIKLFAICKVLGFRMANHNLFAHGDYVPIQAAGNKREHVLAFARHVRNQWSLLVVPRVGAKMVSPAQWPLGDAIWQSTSLPLPKNAPKTWRNVLTGEALESHSSGRGSSVMLRDLFRSLPVALLSAGATAVK
jgi:(1->4)-alpha-D-glucan 1-alpha-D-glucosylmutase